MDAWGNAYLGMYDYVGRSLAMDDWTSDDIARSYADFITHRRHMDIPEFVARWERLACA